MLCISFDKGLINESAYEIKYIYKDVTEVFLGTKEREYTIHCNTIQEAEILLNELIVFVTTILEKDRYGEHFKEFSMGELMIHEK